MIPGLCVCLSGLIWVKNLFLTKRQFVVRHLMEKNNLGGELFRLVNVYLEENGLKGLTRHDCRCHDH